MANTLSTERMSINDTDDILKVLGSVEQIYTIMKRPDSLWNKNKEEFKEKVYKHCPKLYEKYPAILNIVFSDRFDDMGIERLRYMLNMASKVQQDDVKEHDASVEVGQRLVDDFVKPQLNKK